MNDKLNKEYQTIMNLYQRSYSIEHVHAANRMRKEFHDYWIIIHPQTDRTFSKLMDNLREEEQKALKKFTSLI